MIPLQKSSAPEATLKPPQRAKSKKKRDLGAKDAEVAKTPSEFSFAIAKTAVAQICQSAGYKRSTHDALETLTNVAMKYLEAIARSAAYFANASNRTDANLFDLINGIHDLCSVQGFPSGSKMHKSNLLMSGALKEIMNFVNLSNEVPFANSIPCKNASGSPNLEPTIDSGSSLCCSKKAKMQGLHIPRWLPDFPEERLYNNCDKVSVKERKCGEKLWEHSLAVEDCSGKAEENNGVLQGGRINGKEEKNSRMELAQGRGRVKFKIGGEEEKQIGLGVNIMNGVCKGRKRVSWNRDKINDCMVEGNEDERSACKRKKIA